MLFVCYFSFTPWWWYLFLYSERWNIFMQRRWWCHVLWACLSVILLPVIVTTLVSLYVVFQTNTAASVLLQNDTNKSWRRRVCVFFHLHSNLTKDCLFPASVFTHRQTSKQSCNVDSTLKRTKSTWRRGKVWRFSGFKGSSGLLCCLFPNNPKYTKILKCSFWTEIIQMFF